MINLNIRCGQNSPFRYEYLTGTYLKQGTTFAEVEDTRTVRIQIALSTRYPLNLPTPDTRRPAHVKPTVAKP